jgi:hypothetical protein
VLIALGAISCVVVAIVLMSRGCAVLGPSEEVKLEQRRTEFKEAMEKRRAVRMSLVKERRKINERMKAMVDAVRASLPKGATDAEIKAKLEKDVEWISLYKRAEDLGRALADARGKTMEVMREYKDVASPRQLGNKALK